VQLLSPLDFTKKNGQLALPLLKDLAPVSGEINAMFPPYFAKDFVG
jgi:hypothetical protein